ncbi:MAG: hypothetical protein KKC23_04230 [Proteobacteria bacterium]|nr:hypothetical protein [Pseudomonadota bacterium]
MKNLSAISKNGMMVISAVIMIMAGALVALLPSTSQACGGGSMRSETGYVHVPILNNTGETLTMREMFISVPNLSGCGNNEIRVKAIYFDGVSYYTTSSGSSHCNRWGNDPDKTINHTDYTFSGTKVECKIAIDLDNPISGPGADKEYTIRYYFRYAGDAADRMNEIKFNLP